MKYIKELIQELIGEGIETLIPWEEITNFFNDTNIFAIIVLGPLALYALYSPWHVIKHYRSYKRGEITKNEFMRTCNLDFLVAITLTLLITSWLVN